MTTSTTTHTPGPWEVVGPIRTGTLGGADWQHAGFGVRASEPKQFGGTDIVDKGLHETDARLIAAAPALLDALRALAEFWDNGSAVHPGSLVAREAIHAIHKATGGCPTAMGCPE